MDFNFLKLFLFYLCVWASVAFQVVRHLPFFLAGWGQISPACPLAPPASGSHREVWVLPNMRCGCGMHQDVAMEGAVGKESLSLQGTRGDSAICGHIRGILFPGPWWGEMCGRDWKGSPYSGWVGVTRRPWDTPTLSGPRSRCQALKECCGNSLPN